MANKRYYHHSKNKAQKPQAPQEEVRYSAEQLGKSTSDLGISEATRELLEKNRITTAADLVRRTEKDMYRVQGLGKKMLFEIKDALAKADMELRMEPKQEPQKPPQQPKPTAQKTAQNISRNAQEPVRSSKFGLADRRTDLKQKPQAAQSKQPVTQKATKPEKLTAPLPVEQWRKVMKGGKWGYSDGFKIVIPTMYDEIFCFKEGLASVEIDGKCGYIDKENNVVIPFEYDTAMSFSEGFAMIVKGDKCGYINKDNELVIACQYDAATPFEGGEAKVKKDGKWATLSPDGSLVWI